MIMENIYSIRYIDFSAHMRRVLFMEVDLHLFFVERFEPKEFKELFRYLLNELFCLMVERTYLLKENYLGSTKQKYYNENFVLWTRVLSHTYKWVKSLPKRDLKSSSFVEIGAHEQGMDSRI